jgi:hypothetical protein
MARVATCPQCSHEILILDDDPEAWAKCPECRAFFQIKQASGREIQAATRVDDQSSDRSGETVVVDDTMIETFLSEGDVTHSGASDATVSGFGGDVADSEYDDVDVAPEPELELSDEPISVSAVEPGEATVSNQSEATLGGPEGFMVEDADIPTEDDAVASSARDIEAPSTPTPTERLEHAEDRVDKWFRQTKAQLDTRETAAGDDENRETEVLSDPDASPPTWDDSARMERLPADAERPGAPNTSDEIQSSEDDEASGSDEQLGRVAVAAPGAEEPPKYFIPPGRLPRRKRSLLRTLTAAVLSGVIGLSLGYFVLLWLLGPTGDFLHLARYFPSAILPGDFQTDLIPLPRNSREVPQPDETIAGADPARHEAESAEQQATYTTSTPTNDDEGLLGSEPSGDANLPDTEEPQPIFEPPTATPLAGAGQVPAGQLVNPPSFDADELAVALRAAQDAQPKLVAGNLDDGRDVQRAKGFSYSMLCDLAQKLTFVDATTRVEYVTALQTDAMKLFQETLTDQHTRSDVARIFPKWIASPHRQHGGVFFAGTIAQQAEKGTVIEFQLETGVNQTVVVLVPAAQAAQVDSYSPLGIVGWIVDSPKEKVSGYTGAAPQAVWAGRLLALQ